MKEEVEGDLKGDKAEKEDKKDIGDRDDDEEQ